MLQLDRRTATYWPACIIGWTPAGHVQGVAHGRAPSSGPPRGPGRRAPRRSSDSSMATGRGTLGLPEGEVFILGMKRLETGRRIVARLLAYAGRRSSSGKGRTGAGFDRLDRCPRSAESRWPICQAMWFIPATGRARNAASSRSSRYLFGRHVADIWIDWRITVFRLHRAFGTS